MMTCYRVLIALTQISTPERNKTLMELTVEETRVIGVTAVKFAMQCDYSRESFPNNDV